MNIEIACLNAVATLIGWITISGLAALVCTVIINEVNNRYKKG